MKWNNAFKQDITWCSNINNYYEKLSVAKKVAQMAKDGDVIGFGSGSTSFLAVLEIAKRVLEEHLHILAVPTSYEIELQCDFLDIKKASLNDVCPDWAFDGADEADKNNNLIKGRGGAMFNEKLVINCSGKSYILVDSSKFVDKLGSKFPVPVETTPKSLVYARKSLFELGAKTIDLRLAKSKDGPVITEHGNYILDVKFENINDTLEKDIKSITGVIESGLFIGYPIELLCSE